MTANDLSSKIYKYKVIRLPEVIQLIQIIWLLNLNFKCFWHIMIDLDEIFLNILKIFLIELKFILYIALTELSWVTE